MKSTKLKSKLTVGIAAICGAVITLPAAGYAQANYTVNDSTAAAFMASGSASNPNGANLQDENYGNAGTLAIAPASSTKGAFDSLLLFNTSAAVTQFNTDYGMGNWSITGVQLELASNFGVQGVQPNNLIFNTINAGSFGIDSLSDTSWVVGNGGGSGTAGYPNANNYVDYAYIPTLLGNGYDSLGDFTYTPPGNNVYQTYTMPTDAGLDTAAADGTVSLYFYAADNQVSYLFNSQAFSSNHPELVLTATPTPEPGTLTLLTAALGGVLLARRQKKTS
jgi:PEP-CTERM motif